MVKIKYYEVSHKQFVFGASVTVPEPTYKDDDKIYYIGFGGTRKCIDITVYDRNPIAYLSGLRHDDACALNCELPTGDLGTVLMVKAALQFVVKKYTFVIEFRLIDESSIMCKKDVKISLMYLYFAKHGKTWYMSKFNAKIVPTTSASKHILEEANTYMITAKFKKDTSWAQFETRFLYDVKTKRRKRLCDKLRPLYEQANTFREFIMSVANTYEDCYVFCNWLDKFMSQLLNQGVMWTIKSKVCDTIKITIGKRQTTPFTYKSIRKMDFMNTLNKVGGFCPYGNFPTKLSHVL